MACTNGMGPRPYFDTKAPRWSCCDQRLRTPTLCYCSWVVSIPLDLAEAAVAKKEQAGWIFRGTLAQIQILLVICSVAWARAPSASLTSVFPSIEWAQWFNRGTCLCLAWSKALAKGGWHLLMFWFILGALQLSTLNKCLSTRKWFQQWALAVPLRLQEKKPRDRTAVSAQPKAPCLPFQREGWSRN